MRGKQKKQKPSQTTTVTINGVDLCWTLKSQPRYTTEHGHQGLCISVQLAESVRRELILEYPFPPSEMKPNGFAHMPARAKIEPKVIETDIHRAIDAGWRPTSRGKPFVYLVPDESD